MIIVNARFLTQPLTGVQRYAFEVSMQIKRLAPDTIFITPADIRQTEWARALQAHAVGPFSGHLWEQTTLAVYVLRHKNATLFSPSNTGPVMVSRQMLTLHDLAFRQAETDQRFWFRMWYRWLIPHLLQRISGVFTVSDTMRQEIIRTYSYEPTRISVTYNGLSSVFFKSLANTAVGEKENIILCVGTISPRKNTDRLIAAFLESDRLKDYQLVLIGSTSSLFNPLTLPNHPRVMHLSDADDDCLSSYYRRACVAVCLSAYEGFGLPVLEGLAFGCRTVCSDIPVFRELYEGAVLFCDPDQRQDIIDQLESAALHKPAGNVPLNDLMQRYHVEKAARHILERLQHL